MKKKSKGLKALKIILIVILAILVIAGGLLLVMTRDWNDKHEDYKTTNPAIAPYKQTMVSAHRSGGGIFPENTMMAFEGCINSDSFKTDIFEFDLHITSDGKLIVLHDDTLDRTTNAVELFGTTEIKPENYTYEELRQLNFGENFKAEDGSYPYRGLRGSEIPDNLRAASLEDVLRYLSANGDFGYIIEIKNGDELGYKSADELYRILKEQNLLSKAIIGTFHNEVTAYLDSSCPEMLRSAGVNEVLEFYFSSLLKLNRPDDAFAFDALQIPANQFVIHLGTTRLVNYAHEHNIAVQYWTINEAEDVEMLQNIGADCIMSDVPDMAYDVINSNK